MSHWQSDTISVEELEEMDEDEEDAKRMRQVLADAGYPNGFGPPDVAVPPAKDDAPAEQPVATPRRHLRDRLLSVSDLANLPPVEPLIDGLLYAGTTAQLSGPPGSYKSFLTVGMCCSVALTMNWEGHPVPRGGPVVLIVAEGASGIWARINAWCELSGVDPADLDGKLFVFPEPINLGQAIDMDEAIEVANEKRAALFVFDTRARCTVGLDENSATDQGLAIHAVERLSRNGITTALLIHHTGRDGSHGRGSNAWDGAVWSDLRLKDGADLRCRLHCEKHKDVADGCDHHFRMVPHEVSQHLMPNCDKNQRSTLVAVQSDGLDNAEIGSRSTRTVLDIVRTKAADEGLTRPQILELAGEFDLKRSSVYEAVNVLVKAHSLRNIGTDKRARYVASGGVPTSGADS